MSLRAASPTDLDWLYEVHRAAMIGSAVIGRLLSNARERRVPVVLRVLKTNAEPRALYERLGFTAVSETETHHLMQFSDAQGGV